MASTMYSQPPTYNAAVASQATYKPHMALPPDQYNTQYTKMPESTACTRTYSNAESEEEEFIIRNQDQNVETTAEEEALLDEEMAWASRPARRDSCGTPRLPLPVLIPQIQPGLQMPFSRAWADILADRDVQMNEFLQFIDHLNVCKEASPPLKVVGFAAQIVSFVPHHIPQIVGGVTQLAVGGATYAIARTRIVRYIRRANVQYFVPRGLRATVVRKEADLARITKQPIDATRLAEMDPESAMDASIRDRRLEALQGSIAPLQLDGLPPKSKEQTTLDRMSQKMVDRKTAKTHKKMVKDRRKGAKDNSKEERKRDKEMDKLKKEMEKVQRKARKEMSKKPQDAAKIEKELAKESRKIEKEMAKEQKEFEKKTGETGEKEEKKAKKFMWVVIEDMESFKEREAEDARLKELR